MFGYRLAYSFLLYGLVPLFAALVLYRHYYYRTVRYTFPFADLFAKHGLASSTLPKTILYALRLATLVCLLILACRPQKVDEHSSVEVEGVAIQLVMDVSGSMQLFDDLTDRRSRFDVAKTEAVRFIEQRTNDPIGLVLFGRDVISKCPLTLDKPMLKEIMGNLRLGEINHNGTALATGLGLAVQRLRKTNAKSRIAILLTDGMPAGDELSPEVAIDLAKEFGIKVYTIGVGKEGGGYVSTPFGVQQARESIDMKLLQRIAQETGGKAFRAHNPLEMRSVYTTIDQLEKTKQETTIYHNYYEAFGTLLVLVLVLFGAELLGRFLLWRVAL